MPSPSLRNLWLGAAAAHAPCKLSKAVHGRLRDVAQLGSAPDWGSGGRRFKSCQPDVVWAVYQG